MTLPGPRRSTHIERLHLLYICRLQKLPIYNEILRKLALGQSVRSLARWLREQQFDGCGSWSVNYWAKLLGPLDRQVQRAKERAQNEARRKQRHPPPPSPEKVVEVLATMCDPQMELARAMPEASRRVWNHVDKTLEALTAERCLKFGFLMQQERVAEFQHDREQGVREMQALTDISLGILKMEMLYGVPKRVANPEPAEESNSLLRFSVIDRNLMRTAAGKLIDLIQQGGVGGMNKAAELNADAGTEAVVEDPSVEDNVGSSGKVNRATVG
jgi:hypothetical protein